MDPRFDVEDLLFPSIDLPVVGALVMVLIITRVNEGFDDEDRSHRSFLSCLPRSVPEDVAGAARGLLSKSSLIGLRAGTFKSSLPPLPLLFLLKVAVDSDEDWAVDGAANAPSSSISRRRLPIRLITYQSPLRLPDTDVVISVQVGKA